MSRQDGVPGMPSWRTMTLLVILGIAIGLSLAAPWITPLSGNSAASTESVEPSGGEPPPVHTQPVPGGLQGPCPSRTPHHSAPKESLVEVQPGIDARHAGWFPGPGQLPPPLHVLKLTGINGGLWGSMEHGMVPGYLYSGKVPQNRPIVYLKPLAPAAFPSDLTLTTAGIRHLHVFDVRPPSWSKVLQALWGPHGERGLDEAALDNTRWARPGHSIGLSMFRDEQGQFAYTHLDTLPWGFIFRTFWHDALPGSTRPNVPLGSMHCRGSPHAQWLKLLLEHLAALTRRLEREYASLQSQPSGGGLFMGESFWARHTLPAHDPPADVLNSTLLLVSEGGGGGYRPGKAGPSGGWHPGAAKPKQRPNRPSAAKNKQPQRGKQRQRAPGELRPSTSRPMIEEGFPSLTAPHRGSRGLAEGRADVAANKDAVHRRHPLATILAAVRKLANETTQRGFAGVGDATVAEHLLAMRASVAVKSPVDTLGAHVCLLPPTVALSLKSSVACFQENVTAGLAFALAPRELQLAAEHALLGMPPHIAQQSEAAATRQTMQSVGAWLSALAGRAPPPVAPAPGDQRASARGLLLGQLPAAGLFRGAAVNATEVEELYAERHSSISRADAELRSAQPPKPVDAAIAASLCTVRQHTVHETLARGGSAAQGHDTVNASALRAAHCDVTRPVWNVHVEYNWVYHAVQQSQLVRASLRPRTCAWHGSLRAYRANTVSFFRSQWNPAAARLFGDAAVQCDMLVADAFLGEWGADLNHAYWRDTAFGLNPAGNSATSIRLMDQLALGVITVTVTAEAGANDTLLWTDAAWPCGRPPGVYAASWLEAAETMQALWANPVELDALQAAGLAWFNRYHACVQLDAEEVVGTAIARAEARDSTRYHADNG